MTTLQWTGVNQVTLFTVGAFRAWGQEFCNALASIGLAKTSDTGQIDWTTVALPTAGVYAGYEVHQFTDSITSYPIYLRFDFGMAASGGSNSRVNVQVGFGTNGAGTITGPNLGGICIQGTGGNVATPVWSMCKTDGIFWFTMVGQTGADGGMVLERRVNQTTGALIDGRDIRLATFTSANNASYQCLNYGTAFSRTGTLWAAANLVWATQGSGLSGGDLMFSNTYSSFPDIELSDSHLYYRSGEVTANTTKSATVFSSRTYMATNQRWHSAAQLNAMFMGVWV